MINYQNNSTLTEWPEIPTRPLPPELSGLPTIEAKIKYRIAEGRPRPGIEGPIFDREGNFYLCHTLDDVTYVKKITSDGDITDFFRYDSMIVGLAVHHNGTIFGADLRRGGFIEIDPEGNQIGFIETKRPDGSSMMSDDMVFDARGNLYFTDFEGNYYQPKGGIYRIDADDDYRVVKPVLIESPGTMNGISFSPDFSVLWVADSAGKRVLRIILDQDGLPIRRASGVFAISLPYGVYHPDSNKVDTAGNLYQAMMHGGWVLIYDSFGVPIANVVVPDRQRGRLLNTPNLAICPGSNEAYLCASDEHDVVILNFPTLAPGMMLYSHM